MPETTLRENEHEPERTYRTILVPTDWSRGARRGVRRGFALAADHGATVHLLYVVDEHTHGTTPALSSEELVLEKSEEEARRGMDEAVSTADAMDLDVVVECVRGVPHEAITHYATDHDVDLIVMGVHGGERQRRPHVGSTTDRVIRGAGIPVLPV